MHGPSRWVDAQNKMIYHSKPLHPNEKTRKDEVLAQSVKYSAVFHWFKVTTENIEKVFIKTHIQLIHGLAAHIQKHTTMQITMCL